MLGALTGDFIASGKYLPNYKASYNSDHSDYESLHIGVCSVVMCATAEACYTYWQTKSPEQFKAALVKSYKKLIFEYKELFADTDLLKWCESQELISNDDVLVAVRAVPIGLMATSLEQAEELAIMTAEVTHNNQESIKGAKAIATAIFLARKADCRETINKYITDNYYQLDNFTSRVGDKSLSIRLISMYH